VPEPKYACFCSVVTAKDYLVVSRIHGDIQFSVITPFEFPFPVYLVASGYLTVPFMLLAVDTAAIQ
jgi:hypothetical protein